MLARCLALWVLTTIPATCAAAAQIPNGPGPAITGEIRARIPYPFRHVYHKRSMMLEKVDPNGPGLSKAWNETRSSKGPEWVRANVPPNYRLRTPSEIESVQRQTRRAQSAEESYIASDNYRWVADRYQILAQGVWAAVMSDYFDNPNPRLRPNTPLPTVVPLEWTAHIVMLDSEGPMPPPGWCNTAYKRGPEWVEANVPPNFRLQTPLEVARDQRGLERYYRKSGYEPYASRFLESAEQQRTKSAEQWARFVRNRERRRKRERERERERERRILNGRTVADDVKHTLAVGAATLRDLGIVTAVVEYGARPNHRPFPPSVHSHGSHAKPGRPTQSPFLPTTPARNAQVGRRWLFMCVCMCASYSYIFIIIYIYIYTRYSSI